MLGCKERERERETERERERYREREGERKQSCCLKCRDKVCSELWLTSLFKAGNCFGKTFKISHPMNVLKKQFLSQSFKLSNLTEYAVQIISKELNLTILRIHKTT